MNKHALGASGVRANRTEQSFEQEKEGGEEKEVEKKKACASWEESGQSESVAEGAKEGTGGSLCLFSGLRDINASATSAGQLQTEEDISNLCTSPSPHQQQCHP
jgi:hypothetical protein